MNKSIVSSRTQAGASHGAGTSASHGDGTSASHGDGIDLTDISTVTAIPEVNHYGISVEMVSNNGQLGRLAQETPQRAAPAPAPELMDRDETLGLAENLRFDPDGRPILPTSPDELKKIARAMAKLTVNRQLVANIATMPRNQRPIIRDPEDFDLTPSKSAELCFCCALSSVLVASCFNLPTACIVFTPPLATTCLPCCTPTTVSAKLAFMGYSIGGSAFLLKSMLCAGFFCEKYERDERVKTTTNRYMNNQRLLINAIRINNTNNAQRGILNVPKVRYAYSPNEAKSANIIKQNICTMLAKSKRKPVDTCIDEMRDLCNVENVVIEGPLFTELDKNHLSGKKTLGLIWNYLDQYRPENKKAFLVYCATAQGCPHGREEQLLMFFEGLDLKLLPQPNVDIVRNISTLLPHEMQELKLHVISFISQAHQLHHQTKGQKGLDPEASKETTQRYIQSFANGKKVLEGEKLRPMTRSVFIKLFDPIWDMMEKAMNY